MSEQPPVVHEGIKVILRGSALTFNAEPEESHDSLSVDAIAAVLEDEQAEHLRSFLLQHGGYEREDDDE